MESERQILLPVAPHKCALKGWTGEKRSDLFFFMAIKFQTVGFWVMTPCCIANVSEEHTASIFSV
jgi:hypothetical protein